MQYKIRKKIGALALSATLICQIGLPTGYAQENISFEEASQEIVFSGLKQVVTTGAAIEFNFTKSVSENLASLTAGEKIIVNGNEATYGGDVSAKGINIVQSEYATDGKQVIYKAGNGYILITWPTQAGVPYLVTLHDANIDIAGTGDVDAINIFGRLDINLEGENSLKAPRNAINSSNSSPKIIIKGDGTIDMESSSCGVKAEMGYVTIQDNVVLNSKGAKWGVVGGYYEDVIIKDNAKANISVIPDEESYFENYAIRCGNLYVKGNAEVDTNGKHPFISTRIGVEVEPTASLNAIVRGVLGSTQWPHTVYGTVTILENAIIDLGAEHQNSGPFSAAEGASLINNGTIKIKQDISLEQLKALNITNNGTLMLGSKAVQLFGDTLYEDKGTITGNIDFKTNMPTEPTYYKKFDGYMLFRPVSGTENASITLHGINLEADNNLFILPDEMTDVILEGENKADIIRASKNFNLKGNGTLNALRIETTSENVQMNIGSDVKLNSEYRTGSNMIVTSTFYGKNEVAYAEGLIIRDDQKVVLKSGSELKFLGQGFMQIEEGSLNDLVIENGASIVNDSHIFLPIGTTGEQIKALNLKGGGSVRVVKEYENGSPKTWDTYTNAGKEVVEIKEDLNLGDTEVTEVDNKGYTWTKEENEGAEIWTLTLKDVLLTGNIDLPNKEVIINTEGESYINGNINNTTTDTGYANPINPVFRGRGVLTINGSISGGTNQDTMTVKDGARVNIVGNLFLGASGGQDGTINIIGKGTVLDIKSDMSYAILADKVNILDGATFNAASSDQDGIGVEAISEVNITGGSTLNVGCKYGVYIIDGKLTIDETSKLITNATSAPFCVVDKTGAKTQSEVISLPGLPTGMKIASLTGTQDFSGVNRKYWSLVSGNGSLSVSNEQNDVVELVGAATGLLTFTKPADNGGNNNGNNGNGGNTGNGGTSGGGGGTATEDTNSSTKQTPNLPKVLVDKLVKENTKEFKLNIGHETLKLDLEALKAVQTQIGADAMLAVKKVDEKSLSAEAKVVIGNRPVYDFTVVGVNGKQIKDFGKGKIYIEILYTLGENEKAENIIAYYIDANGKVVEIPNSVYDAQKRSIVFETSHFSKIGVGKRVVEEVVSQAPVFTDIANHWAKEDIAFVTQRGLFGGTAADKFSPNMPMTRGMFVTVLGRLANADVSGLDSSKFADVKTGAYYAPYVEWANKNNIISGTSADKFSPNMPITREQMAAIIANYSKFAGVNPPKLQSDEKGVATRAQVSAVLRRYIEFLESK